MTDKPQNVGIIGAGITGLTLALTLSKAGIPCTIYEAREELQNFNESVILAPNGLRILNKLGIYSQIFGEGFHFDTLEYRDGQYGNIRYIQPIGSYTLYGYRALSIRRGALMAGLWGMLKERKDIEVQFNKRFCGIATESEVDGVIFEFSDGTTATASILVGADGPDSTVRHAVAMNEEENRPRYVISSYSYPRSILHFPESFKLPFSISDTNGEDWLILPSKIDGSQVFVSHRSLLPVLKPTKKVNLAYSFEKRKSSFHPEIDFPKVIRSVLNSVPLQNPDIRILHQTLEIKDWISQKQRIIIMGNAAHPILLPCGQGLNQISSMAQLSNMSLGAARNDGQIPHELGGQLSWLYKPNFNEEFSNWVNT